MVNRFTPKAQASLSTAKRCAEKMGHSYIGSEHLILGILSCDCVGKKFLEDKKITYADVYARLAEIAGTGNEDSGNIRELTPKCKRVIEGSSLCAKRFGSRLIGTEHLLYSVCEENESVGGRILCALGLNLQILKNEIAAFLDGTLQEAKEEKHAVSGAPTLSLYAKNLNTLARQGKCDPLIGRDTELERLIQVLCRRTKNNPCLIGEPGVGKTAIIEGLAQKINKGCVPKELSDKTIVSLDLASMIAGAKYRGEFEDRMRNVLNELKSNDSLILFIDEIHSIMGAGAAEGAVDAASIIKPALARSQVQIIGATTLDEYRNHIEKDSALERRFQPITVQEPTENEAIKILEGLRSNYESFHGIEIPTEVIEYAVMLSVRYINDRFLPDKAIDIIDEACSRVKMAHFSFGGESGELEEQLKLLSQKKEKAILNESFELAKEIRNEENRIKASLESTKKAELLPSSKIRLTKKDIEEVVTQWTAVPISEPKATERESISQLDKMLSKRVVGQEKAIKAVSASIKRGRAGLKNPKRPIGSFLFLGPTGVGKTELAKAIAETVFGSHKSLIRLDMSEYMEKHSVSKLIGSPPGYVGYDDGGILTKSVKKSPYSVVLFDEIEKAHPDIYNILLQILDEGVLTDSRGKQISFKNTVLILTSNIGAKSIVKPTQLGFSEKSSQFSESQRMNEQITDALKKEFNPEFLNRLDEVVIFDKLSLEDTEKIVKIMLDEVKGLSAQIGINISFDESVSKHIAKISFSKEYGARPLRRAIMSLVENPLSDRILSAEINKGDNVAVYCENGEIKFGCLACKN